MTERHGGTSDDDAGVTDPQLVTLERYTYPWQAEATRIRLQEAGIPAFVTEAETSTMLSYVGTALGGVRVRVAASDRQRALQLLADDAARAESAGHWRCSRCDEVNEPAFELCWSCSKPRSAEDAAAPPPGDEPPAAEADVADAGFADSVEPPTAALPADDRSPYRPVVSDSLRPTSPRAGTIDDDATQDVASRVRYAFRASVLGFFLMPPLLHLYSFVLLIGLVGREGGVPPEVRGRFWATCLLNLLGCVWGGIVVAFVIAQP